MGPSITWLHERHFGWTGILAEPADIWHGRLRQNRACAVDYRCVWDTTGEKVQFSEVPGEPGYSTIRSFLNMDMHAEQREIQNTYDVETVSLAELLSQHQAPREIDYLSVDTEGSELEILAAFDFDSYMIRVITVEHNFTANRERLRQLLEARGYERKFEKLSHVDDWYVRRSLIHD